MLQASKNPVGPSQKDGFGQSPASSAALKSLALAIFFVLGAVLFGWLAEHSGGNGFLVVALVMAALACLYGCYVFVRVSRLLPKN